MGQTIACANQKGGVGKTTTVVNLAAYLALAGDRVLVVDLDPQGNATSGFGIERGGPEATLYDVVLGDVPLMDVVRPTAIQGCWIAPASVSLAGAEVELAGVDQRERRVARNLDGAVDAFDYVLLDCPPSLGLLTVNALTAANSVLIPTQCEYYALEGLSSLMQTIEQIRTSINPELEIEGLLRTMFDPRNNLANEVSAQLIEHFGDKVFRTIIPRNVRLAEAPSFGKPALFHDKESRGALAYLALAGEMIRRDELPAAPV